jgi:hypothetical protein
VYDPFDDQDDPNREPPPQIRRIATTPTAEQIARRGEVRPLRTPGRRGSQRSGPDPRVWFIRGSIGVAALAGLWLGLQALFPVSESQVTQAPAPAQTQTIDASAVGAPEPPPAAPPAASQPAPTAVPQAAPAPEGDRLPGLPTPDSSAVAQAAPAQPPAAAPAQPTPLAQAQPTPIPAPAQAEEPAQAAAPEPPAQAAAAEQPAGPPRLEPIPPPPSQAQPAAQQPAPQAPAPKPQAPAAAPPPPASGGGFQISASASPVNPVSEQAVVTVTVRATVNGAPMAGASCMAMIHYRTATAKQPDGGFRTNANGVGSFTLDARGTTYGFYIPVDVTCSGRGGTASARTGFTPVKGR